MTDNRDSKRPEDGDSSPDLGLESAASSIEAARERIQLQQRIGKGIRAAVRHLLAAQEKVEGQDPLPAMRLELLEAIRVIGEIEEHLRGPEPEILPEPVPDFAEEPERTERNRRAYRRLNATYPIQLQPPHNGLSRHDLTRLPISGVTLNVSKGGMLAQIDQGILRHGRYLIRFLGVGHHVQPDVMWGRVKRSRASDDGWEVGIEFESPLDQLS